MLKQINIQNFAIINKMTIDFAAGLTIITGQTGAGKSIVIDAIEQLLGARAAQSMVADNNEFALIEGIFDYNKTIESILKENDFIMEEDYLIISKKIKSDGKSQLKLNNKLVTNDLIRQIGQHLVEIHSQNATYLLSEQVSQQAFIDNLFSKNEQQIYQNYQKDYQEYQELLTKYTDLKNNTIDPELLSFYQEQLKEIEINNLSDAEVEQLTNQEAYYKDFEKISERLTNALKIIDSNNVLESLSTISNEVSKLSDVNDNFNKLASTIDEIYYNTIDFNDLLKTEYNSLSFDSNEYELIKEKLFNYQKMIKKYSYSSYEVNAKITDLEQKIDFILNSDSLVKKFEAQIKESKTNLTKQANELNKIRLNYCAKIEKEIHRHLNDLYLKDALFKVELMTSNLTRYGSDKVVFKFSANKGNIPKEIGLVASGGELSRLMLALKIVSLTYDDKMYIFDEIDAGVSGEVAAAIGKKVKEISLNNDVICITHLPQVAIYAKNHLYIEKSSNKQFTTSNCYYLDGDLRINELAKMLSGDKITDSALIHAKELLNHAND